MSKRSVLIMPVVNRLVFIFLCVLPSTLHASSSVTVTVAPDQPIPHIYVGEPLIIEFVADQDMSHLRKLMTSL